MIDDIYKKERKYIPSYDKDNILCERSPIFHLVTSYKLKSITGVEHPEPLIQAQLTTIPSQLHLIKSCEVHDGPAPSQVKCRFKKLPTCRTTHQKPYYDDIIPNAQI